MFLFLGVLQGGKHFSRKVAGFLKPTGVRLWLFLRGESAHAERTPRPRAGRVPSAGGVVPAAGPDRRPALGHLAASPPLLHSSCPNRCAGTTEPASRALIAAPSRFLRRPPASFPLRLLGWRLRWDARKTTSRNFPVWATFPHLGDCSSRGGEV